MKKTMTRLLSFMLVLLLVVSAIPAALAAGNGNDEEENPVTTPSISISGPTTGVINAPVELTAEVSNVEGDYIITWSGAGEGKTGPTCTVTSATAGPVSVTATLTVGENSYPSESYTVTFEKMTIVPSVTNTISLALNAEVAVTPSYSPALPEGATCNMELTPDDPSVVQVVDNNKLKGLKAATTTVRAHFTLDETDTTKAIDKTIDISVSVGTPAISCANDSVKVGKTTTLTPKIELPTGATVTYEYTTESSSYGKVTLTPSTDTKSVSVHGDAEGQAKVVITATVKDSNGNTIATPSKNVAVGVYQSIDVEATMSGYSFTVGGKVGDAFSSVYKSNSDNNIAKTNPSTTLYDILNADDGVTITVEMTSSSAYGDFTDTNLGRSDKFNASGIAGTAIYSYTVEASQGVMVRQGTLKIATGSGTGDIFYTTSSNKRLTFDEDDFLEFWDDQDFKSSLNYVIFDLGYNAYPQYGKLYTDTSCKTGVSISMKFQPNYANSSAYMDLDTVTYDPTTYASNVQRVTVPFTCYGKDTSEKVSGVIVISLSDTGISITSRGIVFGSGSDSVVAEMESIFKTATGKTLNYVTFPTLDSKSGKLFSSFSGMLSSSQVSKDWKFYVSTTVSGQLKLEDVAFVPRAGLYGTVSIPFVGYASSGESATCTLTLNVTEKTKSAVFSDVTASSYSWAADSVDFLYYEEVANGSNGKYNPKSNITRGDFMLMLYRAFLEEDYGNYNVTSNFPDVVKGTTSYSKETYQAVGVAKYLGIAQGSNGKYNPKAYITREEAMTLIYRTLDEVGYSMSYTVSTSTSSFSDYSSVSSYARAAIKDLIGHGVVIGTNGKIQPKSNITRAEMAVILHRVLTY